MQHRKAEHSNKDFSFCLEITLLSIADAAEPFPTERPILATTILSLVNLS